MWDLIVSVLDHCLAFYFEMGPKGPTTTSDFSRIVPRDSILSDP